MSAAATTRTAPKTRQTYEFELLFRFTTEVGEFTDPMANALYESGCADALIGISCGHPYIAFSREAPSFRVALLSAIADVERADVGIELIGVRMEDEGLSPSEQVVHIEAE